MSITKFAFLPPNSSRATIHIFLLWLYAKYTLYLVFTHTTPFPVYLHIRRKTAEQPNCHTQLLGYWRQFKTVFKTLKRKKSRPYHLCPSLLLTGSPCLASRVLVEGGHSSWGMSLLYSPLHLLGIKASSLFSKLCLHVFNLALVGREGQDFGQQHYHWTAREFPDFDCWRLF